MRILILGASGMLGSTLFKKLSLDPMLSIWGTLKSSQYLHHFPESDRGKFIEGIDAKAIGTIDAAIQKVQPDCVINCIGVIKQSDEMHSAASCIHINALFPHLLWDLCKQYGIRLIHISTDCVFDGIRGGYTESDQPNAIDLYGQSKALGEILEQGALTLRTSIIGHELETNLSLLNWFLSQSESVRGYKNAIFSGLTTVEMANLLNSVVLGTSSLSGLYHVASEPIDKFSLLMLIKTQYDLSVEVNPDFELMIDRSLNSDKFFQATGYIAPKWVDMISQMRVFNQKYG